jgi:hypothetical protein
MYLVLIAWLYVALMMAVAEATHSSGTILGAIVTFVLYGLVPMAVVLYLMGTPSRRRALRAKEAAERLAALTPSGQSDASGHPPTGPQTGSIPAVREEKR